MKKWIRPALALVGLLALYAPSVGLSSAASQHHINADKPLCELAPIEFPEPSFARAIKYFLGVDRPINPDVQLSGATFSFGPPHKIPGVEHKVVDMTVSMTFDASNVVHKWMKIVRAQEDVDCSSRTVWFPNPTWEVDANGGWIGHFHVKDVKRLCKLGAQIDLITTELDYWNRVGIQISSDQRTIGPIPSNGSSDNTSPLLKVLAQGLGAIAQVVTVGFVPQAKVQAIDGHQAIEESLKMMEGYEKDLLGKTPGAGPTEVAGFTFDFLFTQAGFLKNGNQTSISITSTQNTSNLPSEGEACLIQDNLNELKTGEENVGPEGVDYRVKNGDTLWKISSQYYGSPRYFMMIAAANNIPFSEMDSLSNNRTLRLESIGSLRTRSDLVLVTRRDSIWKIAEKSNGSGGFAALDAANRSWLTDRNRIYPLEMIRATPDKK